MKPELLKEVKEKIEQIRYGILKTFGVPLLSLPVSFMIATLEVTDDGYLWCTCLPNSHLDFKKAQGIPVKLKYVQKSEGFFIKLVGRAVMGSSACVITDSGSSGTENDEKQSLLKIKIEEVYSFKKRVTSQNTSFFQAVNILSLNQAY